MQFRRAGQQGPKRTLTAAPKRLIIVTRYNTEQVKYYNYTRLTALCPGLAG